MVNTVQALTPGQSAQLSGHAARWLERQTRAGRTDRAAFEAAARRCYAYAQLPWHDNVLWVSSPPVMRVAAAVIRLLVILHERGVLSLGGGDEEALKHRIGLASSLEVTGLEGWRLHQAVCAPVDSALQGLVEERVLRQLRTHTDPAVRAASVMLNMHVAIAMDAPVRQVASRRLGQRGDRRSARLRRITPRTMPGR